MNRSFDFIHGALVPKRIKQAKGSVVKQDDKQFLDSLDALLEKHRQKLVEELSEVLATKISGTPIVVNKTSGKINKSSEVSIDESIFVIDEKIDGIEKKFDNLTESKTEEDLDAVKSLSKLRSLKKGN